jgi:hypothetical protein
MDIGSLRVQVVSSLMANKLSPNIGLNGRRPQIGWIASSRRRSAWR